MSKVKKQDARKPKVPGEKSQTGKGKTRRGDKKHSRSPGIRQGLVVNSSHRLKRGEVEGDSKSLAGEAG